MKKTIRNLSLSILAFAVTTGAVQAAGWSGDINLMLGNKTLASDDWNELNDHGAIGLLTSFKAHDWPLAIAVDLFGTGKERGRGADREESYTAEMLLGTQYYFYSDNDRLRPYLGAGLSFAFAEQTRAGLTQDDTAIGAWLGAGLQYHAGDALSVSLNIRHSDAEVTFDGATQNAGGTIAGLGIGVHW